MDNKSVPKLEPGNISEFRTTPATSQYASNERMKSTRQSISAKKVLDKLSALERVA